jgi:hypothetical protein
VLSPAYILVMALLRWFLVLAALQGASAALRIKALK